MSIDKNALEEDIIKATHSFIIRVANSERAKPEEVEALPAMVNAFRNLINP